ncbi:MAG TPA: pilus assembly protein TadG-related protein [Terriglobales bacterium]|nr:pilus assembly protein TadG-related protein [Terriglobales bacterium]
MKILLLRRSLRGLHSSDNGQTLVLVAVSVMMLMMMAALGVDVGWLHYQKEQMQKAADASALAGAEAMTYGSNWSQAAQNDATANGYQNGQNGITVTVNSPPKIDPIFKGKAGYVEAIVTQARPTFFMKVAGWSSVNVSARAVASVNASGSGCIYALDPNSDPKSLNINGNVSVSSSCGVFVNSTANNALNIDGNSGYLNAGTAGAGIGVANGGGWNPDSGYCNGTSGFCPAPVNIPQFTDPLLNLAEPTVSGCDYNSGISITGGTQTLSNGTGTVTVCGGGISISGGAHVTFASGTWIICGGGMKVSGSSQINGTGVTFYNTGNVKKYCPGNNYTPISIAGTTTGTLSAPTTGTYAGVLFFQDRAYQSSKNVDASSIDGTAGATFTGALYFPGTNLTYSGTPGVNVSSLLIAYQITISGNTTINDDLVTGGGSPIHTAALAE